MYFERPSGSTISSKKGHLLSGCLGPHSVKFWISPGTEKLQPHNVELCSNISPVLSWKERFISDKSISSEKYLHSAMNLLDMNLFTV